MEGIEPSICERLLDVLVEAGVHAKPPRGIRPPALVVALYEAADAYYSPVVEAAAARQAPEEFARLVDACARVPVKQHGRTAAEQEAVEAFTEAVVQARAALKAKRADRP